MYFWSCGMWDLSSPTRDLVCASCIGSLESKPLEHQGSPWINSDKWRLLEFLFRSEQQREGGGKLVYV